MIILSNDPGTANFGFSVSEFKQKTFRLLEVGQIETTIKNLTDEPFYKKLTKAQRKKGMKKKDQEPLEPFDVSSIRFYNLYSGLINQYDPDEIIIERFQSRGMGGALIESVTVMIGIITALALSNGVKVRLTTAAGWKNVANKIENIDNLYAFSEQYGITPHEVDAVIMGMYQESRVRQDNTRFELWLKGFRRELKRYVTTT